MQEAKAPESLARRLPAQRTALPKPTTPLDSLDPAMKESFLDVRQRMMQVIDFNIKWRFSMYRFGLIICCYKMYLAYELWKKFGSPQLTVESVFGEDTDVLMHFFGICITGLLAAKMFDSYPANSSSFRLHSDLLFPLSITETAVWLWHYSESVDLNQPARIFTMKHLPSSSLYYLMVVLQERYMDAESSKVVKAFNAFAIIVDEALEKQKAADGNSNSNSNSNSSSNSSSRSSSGGGSEAANEDPPVPKDKDL